MNHGWEYRKLYDVAPAKSFDGEIAPCEDKYWCLNLDKIESDTGRIIEYDFLESGNLHGSICKFSTENVLFSKLRPNLNKVVVPMQDGYCTTELVPLHPIKELNREFLSYYLRNPRFVKALVDKTGGAKMPRVKMNLFWECEIPLPKLEIQNRIASELDKINELIEIKRSQLADLDLLAQSLFYEMFGDPIDNPKGWEVKKLSKVCYDVTDGDHSAPPKAESGIPFITISNINKTKKTIDFSNTYFVPNSYYDALKENKKPRKGDVLYTVTGSYGIPVLINDDIQFCFQRHIGLIRPKETLNSSFVSFWAQSPAIKFQADLAATGIAQKTVSISSLRNFPIILPPLSLQNQFAAKIKKIEEQKKLIESSLTDLQTLLTSRMDYWFND